MVARCAITARQRRFAVVEFDAAVKEMKSYAVTAVDAALLGIEVIEGTAIVLVDIPAFYENPLYGGRYRGLKPVGHVGRREDGIEQRGQLIIIIG